MRSLLSEQLAAARANAPAPAPGPPSSSPDTPNSSSSSNTTPRSANSDAPAPNAHANPSGVVIVDGDAGSGAERSRGGSASSPGAVAVRESPPQARLRMRYYQALNLSSQPVQVPERRASESQQPHLALSAPLAIPARPGNWVGDGKGSGAGGGEEPLGSVLSKSFAPASLAGGPFHPKAGSGAAAMREYARRTSEKLPRRPFAPMSDEDFAKHRPHRRDKAFI